MPTGVKRVFVEKREGFDVEKQHLLHDLRNNLKLNYINDLRILNRYDIAGIDDDLFQIAVSTVFSENNQDYVWPESVSLSENAFGVEYLPGQYDQRADSAAQCIQILTSKAKPVVKYAKIFDFPQSINKNDLNKIKNYYINPVDSREACLKMPLSLDQSFPEAPDVAICKDFVSLNQSKAIDFIKSMGLAMSLEDLLFCRDYFRDVEKRNPTVTEIKVIDTYWSDHCRHTTFLTTFKEVGFEKGKISEDIKKTYESYKDIRKAVYGEKEYEKDQCLMDIAVICMKHLRKIGQLDDLEVSDEINACSIEVEADMCGNTEKWLVMFKNETHNHPTEIEPFGGAATCLGGAIRDPLSGRSYVYQAMRITGSGDPTVDVENTIPGKLPQIKITTEAAHGYSSYGNQIGLATGKVEEIYHPRYQAKRMEIGAVMAAAPKEHVMRLDSLPGDVVILVGGRTGRDGCGGATGSSKEHDEESIFLCGSEVQKGNPPEERKIQRLFRNKTVSNMIKKCNDFGAGGVSVAIGELADSLEIDLDSVLKKYAGLDGTELAISESQERMAVVLDRKDVASFISLAEAENLETAIVAEVTDTKRLVMRWRGQKILDIRRDFLDTNGVKQEVDLLVKEPDIHLINNIYPNSEPKIDGLKAKWFDNMKNLNVASQKGLVERFDSTIGSNTVLMPFGGRYQLTPTEGMAAKLPIIEGSTNTCTVMTHGFDPYLSAWSPYHGAQYAVIHSIAKMIAMGGDYKKARLTLQEYFEKLYKDRIKWGKPLSALLGAFKAQIELNIPAIGGKDSMSGTFKDMDVPPTLVSFAVCACDVRKIISPEFKNTGSIVAMFKIECSDIGLPDYEDVKRKFDKVSQLIEKGDVISAHTVGFGGIAATVSKMAFGNKLGFEFASSEAINYFKPLYGSIIVELKSYNIIDSDMITIGRTIEERKIIIDGTIIDLEELVHHWRTPLNKVFPIDESENDIRSETIYTKGNIIRNVISQPTPRVFIPVFPGTNCEYDTARAFERAKGKSDIFVFRNSTPLAIEESIREIAKRIKNSQIIAIPGGFSAGDEPEGSGKFITAVFKNPLIRDEVMDLLRNRDGLILGICNGFQALIKLGLLQYGDIRDLEADAPTLTYNRVGRHISKFVTTKVTSNLSPWFNHCQVGDVHAIPISHGEGRFVANEEWIEKLNRNGQIAAQYVDDLNPNGSTASVEALTSPDGRILGKMGHSERIGNHLYKNIPGNKDQGIFEAGIKYYL
jgi:phosphoribosylformylglycinamidine synthase